MSIILLSCKIFVLEVNPNYFLDILNQLNYKKTSIWSNIILNQHFCSIYISVYVYKICFYSEKNQKIQFYVVDYQTMLSKNIFKKDHPTKIGRNWFEFILGQTSISLSLASLLRLDYIICWRMIWRYNSWRNLWSCYNPLCN